MPKADSIPSHIGQNVSLASASPGGSGQVRPRSGENPNRTSQPKAPRVLAITGGKGGVGKTSIALNLGLILARMGKRVLLLDGDTDLANVNIMLGRYPKYTLEHVVSGECSMREVVLAVNNGLHLIPGANGVQRCIDMNTHDRQRILATLARIERSYHYVLVDTAAGLQASVMHMIAASSMACVVVTPDPTSLTDAFSLLKVLNRRGYKRNPGIVVNMARGASQAQSVFRRFSAAAQRYIGVKPEYLGAIWRDETIAQSITTQRPVALLDRTDPSCRQFWSLAEMLDMRLDRNNPPTGGFAAYWERLARKQAQAKAAPPAAETTGERRPESANRAEPEAVNSQVKQQATPAAPVRDAPDGLVRVEERWQSWGEQLRELMANPETTPLQRYQALTQCMEVLGAHMDEEIIEVLQTGLAAMSWDKLPVVQRSHFAAHLRQLADQVDPPMFDRTTKKLTAAESPVRPKSGYQPAVERPRYDETAFGSQEMLLSRLRSQPAGASIADILESFGYRHEDQSSAAGGNRARSFDDEDERTSRHGRPGRW